MCLAASDATALTKATGKTCFQAHFLLVKTPIRSMRWQPNEVNAKCEADRTMV